MEQGQTLEIIKFLIMFIGISIVGFLSYTRVGEWTLVIIIIMLIMILYVIILMSNKEYYMNYKETKKYPSGCGYI